MKIIKLLWDMPITMEVVDKTATKKDLEQIFIYFEHIDRVFSTFRQSSEISRINRNEISKDKWSGEMKEVIALCEKTKQETDGYFEHNRNGILDPLGIVKGWAVQKAAQKLIANGFMNFYIDAGGDIQTHGLNSHKEKWSVGIRNPFNRNEIVKTVLLSDCGIATSGSYIRGDHIYNPIENRIASNEVLSITVIGPNVYEADRFATASFAMGKNGIYYIERTAGLEGYLIDRNGIATYTSGFEKFLKTASISSFSKQINV